MSTKHYDVVIVGGGNGGMGAAMACAQAGLKPLVIEQHNLPGGCATSIVRGRFEFDASLHVLMYEALGIKAKFEGEYGFTEEFIEVPHGFSFGGPFDKKLEHYPFGVAEFVAAACEMHPEWAPYLQKYVAICLEVFGAVNAMGQGMPMEQVAEQFPAFVEFSTLTSQQGMDKLGIPQDLQQILSMLWFYEGASVEDYSFIAGANMLIAIWGLPSFFPKHTCHGYLAEFETGIRKRGGDVWYNTKVTKINVVDGKVVSVETDKGDIVDTNLVISNASPKTVYQSLISPKSVVDPDVVELQGKIVDNMSFMIVWLGLDASAEELGIKNHHIFINSGTSIETYKASFTRHGPYCIGALCPNVTIPDFSPEGTCVLSLSVPMRGSALDGLDQTEYLKEKNRLADEIVQVAGEYMGVDLKAYIEEIEVATPATIARYAALPNGSLGYLGGGIGKDAADAANAAMLERGNFANGGPIENLHFVGQYYHGIGYPNIMKGIATAEALINKEKEM